ncbi:MAG: baseplate J/gp47 family protein, partial [Caldilineaceae bacterium]|nr:baseplate J/gp47 family protein [Caldilineaceae bacterium]
VGLVTFFRDPNSVGNITIPENVLLSTTKGEANFQTSQLRTLQVGQLRIDVPVRAADDFRGEAGKVAAGAITQMVQPIAGIARITNFDATFLGAEDESDDDLRARAKAALRSLGKATIAALTRVIFEGNGKLTELWDPNSPPAKRATLGTVSLLIEAEPERFPSLRAAVEETRAAGVQATVIARYVYFKPRALVTIAAGLTAAGKLQVVDDIIAALQEYVDGLSSGDPAVGADLLSTIKEVDDVTDAQIVDVMTWRSDVGQPGAASLIDSVVTAVEGTAADDKAALRAAITVALTEMPPLTPTNSRIPDRSFVQGPTGQRATDDEIESADFNVVAEYQGQQWWVVLDIAPADIVLRESE